MAPGDEALLQAVKEFNKVRVCVSMHAPDSLSYLPIYMTKIPASLSLTCPLTCYQHSHTTMHAQFDLYTKDEGNALDVEALWPYYQGLIDKYLPAGPLRW